MNIYAYGGGEMLAYIFNGVAMLTNGANATFLIKIALTIGALVAFVISAIKSDPLHSIKWVAWYTAALSLMFVPKMKIVVNDVIAQKHYAVDNVPWILAKTAGTISTFGYGLTKQFENVFRTPGNFDYHKTGTLFASRIMEDSSEITIHDATIKQNFNNFISQCVFYDLAIGGKYTFDELLKTNNIWKLFRDNASRARFFPYLNSETKNSEFVTCRVGADRLHAKWEGIINSTATSWGLKYFPQLSEEQAKSKLLEQLPLANRFLANSAINANQIIQQKLMSNIVKEGLMHSSTKMNATASATKFAADRAYEQQKNAYIVTGKLAAKTLVNMKVLFEGLIYALFPLVMILALMTPLGYKQLLTYGGLILWVNSWPIVYAVLNFFMTYSAKSQSVALLSSGLDGASMMVSGALSHINADIAAQAGYLSMSIPFVSYAIIKGGAASFVHLASHLGGIAQGVASQASSELTTGNYGFGNVNSGNISYDNTSSNKLNTDLMSSSGAQISRDMHGGLQSIFSGGTHTLDTRGATSNLMDNMQLNGRVANSLQQSASSELRAAQSEAQAYMESQAATYTNTMQFAKNWQQAKENGETWANDLSGDLQKSLATLNQHQDQFIQNTDKSEGMSMDASAKMFAQVNAGGAVGKMVSLAAGVSGGLDAHIGANHKVDQTEKNQAIEQAMQSQEFKSAMSQVERFAQNNSHSIRDSETQSYLDNISSSISDSQSHQDSMNTSLTTSAGLSDMASRVRSGDVAISQNISQDFMDWNQARLDRGEINQSQFKDALYGTGMARAEHTSEFLDSVSAKMSDYVSQYGINSASDVQNAYNSFKGNMQSINPADYQAKVVERARDLGNKSIDNGVKDNVVDFLSTNKAQLTQEHQQLHAQHQHIQQDVRTKQAESLSKNLAKNITGNFVDETKEFGKDLIDKVKKS